MPRAGKVDPAKPKAKRIRKKPDVLNPTYASLKTGSHQKNPIVFAACGKNVYVMRKLVFTEEVELPALITVDLPEAEKIFHKLMTFGARSDERAQEANLGNTEMQEWREKHNVYEKPSMYSILTQNERDKITLYHVFKLWPGKFVPHSIATVSDTATEFWHKQRGRKEPIHCRVVFTGELLPSAPKTSPTNTVLQDNDHQMSYVREKPQPFTEEQTQLMWDHLLKWKPSPLSSSAEYSQRERIYVACANNVYCVPLFALTEESSPPSVITVDLNEVGDIVNTIRPLGFHLDERGRKATLTRDNFKIWADDRNICEETSIFSALTAYSRDLITIYWLFKKAPKYKGIRPFSFAKIQPGQRTFQLNPTTNPTHFSDISCELVFTGKDPFEGEDLNWPSDIE